MTQKPLDILKKGLERLEKSVKGRKEKLEAQLAERKAISSSDEQWLDNEANTVEEQQIIFRLEKASDYENELGILDEREKVIVKKLREWAGDIAKAPGAKRKRPEDRKLPKKTTSDIPPCFTHKEVATLEQRIEILNWHSKNGRNQTQTADHFKKIYPNLLIKQPLISAWVKRETYWHEQWALCQGEHDRSAKRIRQTEHPEVTEMMDLWVASAMENGILLNGEILRQKWTAFADLTGVPTDERLNLSNGWLGRFKARHSLREYKRHGEAASANMETAEQERQRIQDLIKQYGYQRRDIFNMDETGLFYGMPPDRGLSDKQLSGVKGTKVRLTYALTSNADGTEKLPPFIIGKAYKPRAFKNQTGAKLGFYYKSNAKAWMKTDLYQEWIKQWDGELVMKRRHVLLLQDNFSGHVVPDNLQNIRVLNFKPNLTALIQPMDQGIIRCFKAHYRAKFIQRAINRYDMDITPSQIYEINQLQGMRLAYQAWKEVDATTIQNCWNKAGILPEFTQTRLMPVLLPVSALVHDHPTSSTSTEDPAIAAETAVEKALDDLVSRGALQAKNRMSIESLLNPASETYKTHETTEEEIYQSVIAARDAWEEMEKNGGDDIDNDAPTQPRPTPREFLQAASIISRYLDESNEPPACQLESTLGLYCRGVRVDQSNSFKETTLLKYFKRL